MDFITPARITAFLIHLAASAAIALLALLLVFILWYPAPLHTALGVTHIFLLLLLIDVILGPLLTLLVFKVGKKSQRRSNSKQAIAELARRNRMGTPDGPPETYGGIARCQQPGARNCRTEPVAILTELSRINNLRVGSIGSEIIDPG